MCVCVRACVYVCACVHVFMCVHVCCQYVTIVKLYYPASSSVSLQLKRRRTNMLSQLWRGYWTIVPGSISTPFLYVYTHHTLTFHTLTVTSHITSVNYHESENIVAIKYLTASYKKFNQHAKVAFSINLAMKFSVYIHTPHPHTSHLHCVPSLVSHLLIHQVYDYKACHAESHYGHCSPLCSSLSMFSWSL